jgi:predicted NAD-dependent protein-ADP-ribosyltransferase YbiA (DUF1768 family)
MFPAKVPLEIGGEKLLFKNAEAAFQAQKNPALAKQFLNLDGFAAKRLGRQIPITQPDWNTYRDTAMRNAVSSKFNSNPDLMEQLKALADDYISEENDWGDTYWGVSGGRGQNKLGNILMDIRDNALVAAPAVVDTITDITPTPVDDAVADNLTNIAVASGLHPLGNDIITKIISGGQTGADILGLQLAQKAGIPTGGTISYGPNGNILTEFDDGIDRTKFGFDILDYPGNIRDAYVNRTNLNAANSDGTIYFRGPEQGNGWFATKRAAQQAGKPFLDNPQSSNEIVNWALANNVKTLNIAGNRGSKMSQNTRDSMTGTLQDLFYDLKKQVGSQTIPGDMLTSTDPLLMHQVNAKGTMGSGIAKDIRDQLLAPGEYDKYVRISANNPASDLMGKVLPLNTKTPGQKVLNVFGQETYGWDPNTVYTDYDALRNAFTNIANRYPAGTRISMPVNMGAGRAHGDWNTIEKMADELLGRKLLLTKYKK